MTSPDGHTTAPDAARTASAPGPPPRAAPASDVVVRVATPADAAVMVELRAVMFEGMGTAPELVAHPGWRRAAHAWFTARAVSETTRIVVAQVEGRVVSGAVGEVTALIPGPHTVNGSVGLISNVATLAPWRGRGLAAACTDELLRWFEHDTDVTRVDLFATEDGARIYAVRGFTVRQFPAMCLPVRRSPAVN